MRVTSKGQVTIPQAVREALGFLPNTEVDFVLDGEGGVRLVKACSKGPESRGQRVVRVLRSGAGRLRMSTEELMALTRGEDEWESPAAEGTDRDATQAGS